MPTNNPFTAYQRYATNSLASPKAIKVNNEALTGDVLADIAADGGAKSPQLQSPVRKPVNYSQVTKNFIDRTDILNSTMKLNTESRMQEIQQAIAVSKKGSENPKAAVEKMRAEVKLPVETRFNMPINSQVAQSASHYMESEIMTASPEKLTLMLYDGAIRFMSQAVIHIEGNCTEKTNKFLLRAQDIYAELMSTLDMKYEVSKNLYSLYDFIKNSLMQANLKKDPNLIREMISMTRDLRNTWEQVMEMVKKVKK